MDIKVWWFTLPNLSNHQQLWQPIPNIFIVQYSTRILMVISVCKPLIGTEGRQHVDFDPAVPPWNTLSVWVRLCGRVCVCEHVCVTWTAQPSISNKSLFRSSMLLAGDNTTQRHAVCQNRSSLWTQYGLKKWSKAWWWLRPFHTSGSITVYCEYRLSIVIQFNSTVFHSANTQPESTLFISVYCIWHNDSLKVDFSVSPIIVLRRNISITSFLLLFPLIPSTMRFWRRLVTATRVMQHNHKILSLHFIHCFSN